MTALSLWAPAWRWGLAAALWFGALIFILMGVGIVNDQKKEANHIRDCAAVAESIEGFRRCVDR